MSDPVEISRHNSHPASLPWLHQHQLDLGRLHRRRPLHGWAACVATHGPRSEGLHLGSNALLSS